MHDAKMDAGGLSLTQLGDIAEQYEHPQTMGRGRTDDYTEIVEAMYTEQHHRRYEDTGKQTGALFPFSGPFKNRRRG